MATNITTIQGYFDLLETEPAFTYNGQLTPVLLKLRDGNDNEAELAAIALELFVIDQTAVDGKITGKMKYADGSSFPDTDLIGAHLDRLKARALAASNPKYSAKYNHVLWDSKAKHIQYARAAVDSYIQLIAAGPFPLPDNTQNHLFETAFQNLFMLSQAISYRKEEAITILLAHLEREDIHGYKKQALMRYICDNGKKLDLQTLQHFYAYANQVINSNHYSELIENYLELLIYLSQRLGVPQKPYFIKMAELQLRNAAIEKEPFLQYDLFESAMANYQRAGEPLKAEETAAQLEQVKKHLHFGKQKIELTDPVLQTWWDQIQQLIEQLTTQGDPGDIFAYLIGNEALLPGAESLDKPIVPVTFQFITVKNFDINRNVDREKPVGINAYHLSIQNFTMRQLWLIFTKAVAKGKLNYDTLINHFRNHSWYGQDFTVETTDGLKHGFNWIDLLAPGFKHFFEQSKIDLETQTNNHQGYILATDSLVLKFEGVLREFSRMVGAQTIERKDSGTSERISFDKLLENEKLTQIIPPRDIAFFRYLFTGDGINLRNNIAHCFYKASDYSAGTIMLLIVAFLRLGNYELKSITTPEPPVGE